MNRKYYCIYSEKSVRVFGSNETKENLPSEHQQNREAANKSAELRLPVLQLVQPLQLQYSEQWYPVVR